MYNLIYEILDADFKKDDYQILINHYDGINFSGCIYNGNDSRTYSNGDKYEKSYIKDENNNIVKVIIKFYDKKNNVTYSTEKEINNEIVYKMDDSFNASIVSKEEYMKFVNEFINKNNYTIDDLLKKL